MAVSAAQFWAQSNNGKAMLNMLAQRQNTELVRDACEWLVDTYRQELVNDARKRGASNDQAKTYAFDATNALRVQAENVHEGNTTLVVNEIVDKVFKRYERAGQAKYAQAMQWLADELRKRVSPDTTDRDGFDARKRIDPRTGRRIG